MGRVYKIYYITKANSHGYLKPITVSANTKKDAIKSVKETVKAAGHNAFRCTTKTPLLVPGGLEYDGYIYTRYCEHDKSLW